MNYKILQGDNRTTLKTLADNSIDAIVTDPPYGIDFLGKSWDANTGALETYQECLRVLKPGGHILAFSAARTYHHLAITLEQAGFEIRDQIMWIYSSGFPKSQDVGKSIQRSLGVKETKPLKEVKSFGATTAIGDYSNPGFSNIDTICTDPEAKQWEGWGTALKPAHEPICLARKPIKLSIAKNCQQWGVGALNIDATRVPYLNKKDMPGSNNVGNDGTTFGNYNPEKTEKDLSLDGGWDPNIQGRFPSNVLGEIPDYQKYFYCPKVSRRERHVGFEEPETQEQMLASIGGYFVDHDGNKIKSGNKAFVPGHGEIYTHGLNDVIKKIRGTDTTTSGNNHPTVKPIELMKYLIKLITPPGGTVLDPFNGSGSTGCAAVELGHPYIGCELDQRYVEITQRRIEAWHKQVNPTTFSTLFTTE